MIKLSNSVANVLDRLYMEGNKLNGSMEQYNRCIEAIQTLVNPYIKTRTKASYPPAWTRGKGALFVCRVDNYSFGYSEYSDGVYIEEVMYNDKIIYEEEQTSNQQLNEVSEFHSWMKRLDKVKGARPTFWC